MGPEDLAFVRGCFAPSGDSSADCAACVEVLNTATLSQSSVAQLMYSGATKLFFKRASVDALRELSPRNPDAKWRVTLRSFINEARFLKASSTKENLRIKYGADTLQVFGAAASSGEVPTFATVFRSCTELVDTHGATSYERDYLQPSEMNAVVKWLASFHRCFWSAAVVHDGLLEIDSLRLNTAEPSFKPVWSRGGWWRKELRPTVNFALIPSVYARLMQVFEEQFTYRPSELGAALQAMARLAASDTFLQMLGPPRTMIHGDAKSANVFFFYTDERLVPKVFDFQWTGPASSGLGDLVYLFYGSFDYRLLSAVDEVAMDELRRAEESIRRDYYAFFSMDDMPLSDFNRLWNLELLDYFSTSLPYLLRDLTPNICVKNRVKHGYLAYECDARVLSYFCRRAVEAMLEEKLCIDVN